MSKMIKIQRIYVSVYANLLCILGFVKLGKGSHHILILHTLFPPNLRFNLCMEQPRKCLYFSLHTLPLFSVSACTHHCMCRRICVCVKLTLQLSSPAILNSPSLHCFGASEAFKQECPAGQTSQVTAPSFLEYLPAGQGSG